MQVEAGIGREAGLWNRKKKKKFKCKPMVKVGAKEEAGSQQPHSESEPLVG